MNLVRSANKFLQANSWCAKAYLTNDTPNDKGQLFGIMAFVNGDFDKPTVLFADGTYIEYKNIKVEDTKVLLTDCVLYYSIDKTAIKEVSIQPSKYDKDDVDHSTNQLEFFFDDKGYRTLEEYVMGFHLNTKNLAKLDELLIGDSESTVFSLESNPNIRLFKDLEQ